MDAAGAESLRWRLDQQQHWRQAQAVLDGVQPTIDPDLADLEEFDGLIRIYSTRATRDGMIRLCKRLVDGTWQNGTIEAQYDSSSGRAVAQVA